MFRIKISNDVPGLVVGFPKLRVVMAPALDVSLGRRPLVIEDETGGLAFDADVLRGMLVKRGAGAASEKQLAKGRAVAAMAAATEQSASLGSPNPSATFPLSPPLPLPGK